MKKNGILNRDINSVLGYLGHTDFICICDCGLPIPDGIKVVDLSIELNIPSFKIVFDMIKKEMIIEKTFLATEIKEENGDLNDSLVSDLNDIEYISHEDFKKKIKDVKLVIRTGEATPYANIILQGGVIF